MSNTIEETRTAEAVPTTFTEQRIEHLAHRIENILDAATEIAIRSKEPAYQAEFLANMEFLSDALVDWDSGSYREQHPNELEIIGAFKGNLGVEFRGANASEAAPISDAVKQAFDALRERAAKPSGLIENFIVELVLDAERAHAGGAHVSVDAIQRRLDQLRGHVAEYREIAERFKDYPAPGEAA